jgi:sec-independent protein translocase protein TatC
MRLKPKFPRRLKPDEKVSFIEHLEELRYRIIVCLISVLIGTVVAYLFKEEIFKFISAPLLRALPPGEQKLIFTGLLEAFVVYLKMSFFAGLMASVPVVVYQLWARGALPCLSYSRRASFSWAVQSSAITWSSRTGSNSS